VHRARPVQALNQLTDNATEYATEQANLRATERGPLIYTSLGFVALLCVIPFLQPFHQYPLTAFYTEWLAFALGLGVMVILLDHRAWISAEIPWVVLAPFALALLLMVHGVLGWSPYFGHALTGALYLVWAGLLMIAARALARVCGLETVTAVVAASLAAGALLSAAIGLIQYFNIITLLNAFIVRLHGAAIFGNLAQPNHFAAYTTLGLLSFAYLHGRGRLPLPVAVICSLPLLFVLGVSGSRSPWLYLLAAFGFALWLRSVSGDLPARRLFMWTGMFLILHYALQAAVGAGWFNPSQGVAVTAVERLFTGAASVTDRLGLWSAAWPIALEHPVFGVGWGAFSGRYFDFIAEPGVIAPAGLYNNTHNIFLQLFAETGLTGLVLFLTPVAAWALAVLKIRPDARLWWMLATLGVFAIHSMLEYPLWYAYFLGIAALLLGLGAGPVFVPRLARVGRAFAATVILVGAWNLAVLWVDHRQFREVLRPSPEQLRNTDFAAVMTRLHQNTLLAPYVELFTAFPSAVAEENLSGRLLLNGRVIRFTPVSVLVYRQVLLLALAGRLPEAQALLIRVRRVYPAVPPEFERDLARLAREHPARFLPLIESPSTSQVVK
jgi:O-antigen ligase